MLPDKKLENGLTPLGKTNFRNQQTPFGIKIDDRRRHIYTIGKTGSGKTTLLENMAVADIRAGRGIAIVDPHGEFAEKILNFIPEERLDDVIYFNPADMEYPIAFNPLEQVGNEFRHLVASGVMGVFKKIWPDVWSARMEYILNNTLLALLEFPGATLLGIMRMLSEPEYRKKVVANVQDPVIKAFWENEYAKYSQRFESEAVAAIQNKVGQFVSNPLIRNILGQPRSILDMRKVMDEGKILIVNLSKGKVGEDNSALLGAMIITRLQLAAMSRVDIPESERRDFFLYVDEFQNFATESFASILSEARKYRLSLTLAHQYIGQLVTDQNTKVRDAVFGNVGTLISFRVGAADAEFLEKEYMPEFMLNDLVNLSKYHIYIKLMIDGIASHPFSAQTLTPNKTPLVHYRDVIVKNSREKYAVSKKSVEDRIAAEWGSKATSVEEKVTRRTEKPLSEVLRRPKLPNEERAVVPRPAKKEINIDDLRKAISESLSQHTKKEDEGTKPTSAETTIVNNNTSNISHHHEHTVTNAPADNSPVERKSEVQKIQNTHTRSETVKDVEYKEVHTEYNAPSKQSPPQPEVRRDGFLPLSALKKIDDNNNAPGTENDAPEDSFASVHEEDDEENKV